VSGDPLDPIRDRLARAAVIVDYDGTLAPIVMRPEDAVPLPGAADVLAALAPRVRTLAIVTGRPEAFVRDRLPVDGLEVVGLYGLEGAPRVDDALRDAVARAAGTEGASVEDKGASLAVHLRRAPDPEGAEARLRPILASIAVDAGLVVRDGKRVLELSPPGEGKADAVRGLADGADAVLIAGDDVADAEAFRALDDVAASGVWVVRVAVLGSEVPEELERAADLVAEGPEGLLDLLRTL
jgi:trehalose 6-phosphate phosphatase